ncbi:MAG: Glutamyl-tRNA synthetase, partial [Deltaproteobacteria bacterium]|nr:Glutamyl-tRNA synthetase [Deltaproteobacteria bacterium]
VQFPRDHVDDFILMKKESTPSYNFAVVIDDMLMGITHVMRGEDHLSNTPKQIMLFEILGNEPPQYGHLSLLVGDDNKPLSKRHGVTSVKDFRETGILPEALRNYLCTVGRSVRKEIMDIDELITTFSLTSLSRTNSFFDMEKLYWFNKEYMKKTPLNALLKYLDLPDQYSDRIGVLRENAKTLNEMKEYLDIFNKAEITDDAISYLSQLALPDSVITIIAGFFTEYNNPSVENIIDALTGESGLKKKDLYMILRIFLTGRKSGPPLKEIIQLIPAEIVLKRTKSYFSALQKS